MSLEQKIIDRLDRFGDEITSDIKEVLRINNAIASGNLEKSITYKIVEKEGEYRLVISYANYGEYVLRGRKPNSKPPPYAPIIRWTKFKGLPKEAAYPIAKSIGKKGIKPLNFLTSKNNLITNKNGKINNFINGIIELSSSSFWPMYFTVHSYMG